MHGFFLVRILLQGERWIFPDWVRVSGEPGRGAALRVVLGWFSRPGAHTQHFCNRTKQKLLQDTRLNQRCFHVGALPRYSAVIDWGYANNNAYPVDLCLNAMLLSSLQALVSWVTAVDPASVDKCVVQHDADAFLVTFESSLV